MARRSDDRFVLGRVLNLLGQAARMEGKYAEASTLLEDSLALARAGDHRGEVVWALGNLTWNVCRQGDLARAAALLGEAVPLVRDFGALNRTAGTLFTTGDAAIQADRSREGVRLVGAAFRVERYETMLFPDERDTHAASMARARAALGDAAFEVAWAEGQAMTDAHAFTEATAVVEQIATLADANQN